MFKVCSKCNIEKDDFYKNNKVCKNCKKKYQKEHYISNKEEIAKHKKQYQINHKKEILEYKKYYYKNNKEQILVSNKKYCADHKKEVLESKKDYYQNNKIEILQNIKEYRENHKEEISEYQKEYRKIHKHEIIKYQRQYKKNRIKIDLVYRLRKNISRCITYALKHNNSSKNKKSIWNYLDYTPEGLKLHLEVQFNDPGNEWMNWKNYGAYNINRKTWNIDHIIPQSTFKYISMEDEEFNKCWALSNLRPLESKQNILDGVTRIRHNLVI